MRRSDWLITGWTLALAAAHPAAAGSQAALALVPGSMRTIALDASGEAVLLVDADRGARVRLRLDQRGIDVSVAVDGPDGARRFVSNVAERAHGTEMVLFEADGAGPYRVIATPRDRASGPGRLVAQLEPLVPATTADRAAIEAMRALDAALALPGVGDASAADRRARLGALEQVLRQFDSAGDPWGEARTLLEIALVAINAEMPARADAALPRAVALWRTLDDPYAVAFALNLQGLSLAIAGRPADALLVTEESLALALQGDDLATASLAANNLGIYRDTLGDAEAAYDAFTQALSLRARAGGRGIGESATLLNVARLASNLGNVEVARTTYERVLAVARAANSRAVERTAANNLGNLLRRSGRVADAIPWHERSLELAREAGTAASEAQALNGLASDLFELGRYTEAEAMQRSSVAMRRALQDPIGLAAGLQSLGQTLAALGRFDDGLAALQESLALREQSAELRAVPGVWRAMAELEQRRGRLAEALVASATSIALVEALRDKLTAPSLRASFVAGEHAKYELHVDLLMASLAQSGDADFERRAFEAADRGRARVLLDALLSSRVDVRQGVAQALLDDERLQQQRVADASARLSRLLTRQSSAADIATARDALERATADLERLQARLLRDSPAYASLVRPDALTLDTVQRELLDDDTVLLEFSLGPTRGWLWAVTSSSLRSVELPSRAVVEAAVRDLRALYEARVPRAGESASAALARRRGADARLPEASATLSRMLLGPLATELAGVWHGKRLAVVASDAIDYVPLAALPLPGSTRRLLDSHEIVYLPSASALQAVRRHPHAARAATPTVAIIADPVFDAADPRVGRARSRVGAPSAPPPSTPLTQAIRSQSPADALAPVTLGRLSFSGLEAAAIARLLPAARVRLATGFDANRDAVTAEALRSVDVLHLATHGLVSTDRPALTGLVVSLVDRRGQPRDGFLRLSDIYNLRLTADLVVLSACHTALGAEVRGEGLVGLTRGFMYAGARRVVASLWAVDDSATAALMTRFYRGLLRDGLPASAALRAAQREVASRPQWAAPYFWAGFVLQGDWQ